MPGNHKANTRQKRASEVVQAEAEAEAPPAKKGKIVVGSKSRASAAAAASAAEEERVSAQQAKAIVDAKDLEERKKQTLEQLRAVERQIYNLESQYFEATNPQGNALKGYEGLISSVGVNTKKTQFKAEDRIFSTSSVTGMPLV